MEWRSYRGLHLINEHFYSQDPSLYTPFHLHNSRRGSHGGKFFAHDTSTPFTRTTSSRSIPSRACGRDNGVHCPFPWSRELLCAHSGEIEGERIKGWRFGMPIFSGPLRCCYAAEYQPSFQTASENLRRVINGAWIACNKAKSKRAGE